MGARGWPAAPDRMRPAQVEHVCERNRADCATADHASHHRTASAGQTRRRALLLLLLLLRQRRRAERRAFALLFGLHAGPNFEDFVGACRRRASGSLNTTRPYR